MQCGLVRNAVECVRAIYIISLSKSIKRCEKNNRIFPTISKSIKSCNEEQLDNIPLVIYLGLVQRYGMINMHNP